jgi:hypothetical protein
LGILYFKSTSAEGVWPIQHTNDEDLPKGLQDLPQCLGAVMNQIIITLKACKFRLLKKLTHLKQKWIVVFFGNNLHHATNMNNHSWSSLSHLWCQVELLDWQYLQMKS